VFECHDVLCLLQYFVSSDVGGAQAAMVRLPQGGSGLQRPAGDLQEGSSAADLWPLVSSIVEDIGARAAAATRVMPSRVLISCANTCKSVVMNVLQGSAKTRCKTPQDMHMP